MNKLQSFTQAVSLLNQNKFLTTSKTILITSVFLYTYLLTCWVNDDALISFRQIWNLVQGDGITFNFEERVQAFTHPLWFLILSVLVAITNELFVTISITSVAISLAAMFVLLKLESNLNKTNYVLISPVLILIFSWSFVDFSTSGLENCLSNLLIGLLLLVLLGENWKKKYSIIFTLLALLVLNRFDYAVLFFPLVLYLFFVSKNIKYIAKSVLIGVTLIISWLLFATLYFGSPVPNTFHAKLNAGYPIDEFILRGSQYFIEILQDPITVLIIISGIFVSIVSLNRLLITLVIGQLLYMIYILQIGGDFMAGRYFAVLTYLSMAQLIIGLAKIEWFSQRTKNGIVLSTLILCLIGSTVLEYPIFSDTNYVMRDPVFPSLRDRTYNRAYDSRSGHYHDIGLFSAKREKWPQVLNQSTQRPQKYEVICAKLGRESLRRPETYLIDVCGLSEPFLSRVPAIQIDLWVVGHQFRKVPTDYGEYLIGNINELPDKKLNPLLKDISLVTTGKLISLERFSAIWRLNSGFYSEIDFSNYVDKTSWIPITSKDEILYVKNWESDFTNSLYDGNISYEYQKPYCEINETCRIIRGSIVIESQQPKLASAISLIVDLEHEYELYINDEFFTTVIQKDFAAPLVFNLDKPLMIHKIKLKAVNSNYRYRPNNIIWELNLLEHVEQS